MERAPISSKKTLISTAKVYHFREKNLLLQIGDAHFPCCSVIIPRKRPISQEKLLCYTAKEHVCTEKG